MCCMRDLIRLHWLLRRSPCGASMASRKRMHFAAPVTFYPCPKPRAGVLGADSSGLKSTLKLNGCPCPAIFLCTTYHTSPVM